MSDPVFEAFVSRHFHRVFSLMAAVTDAAGVLEVDVPELHRTAGEVIVNVAESAEVGIIDTSRRIALIEGGAGYGKTHRLVATLLDLSRKGKIYPAVMQLSAKVKLGEVSLWMLRKIIEELCVAHFANAQGRTPLKRLADGLWQHAETSLREEYRDALERKDLDAAASCVSKAVPQIQRALQLQGLTGRDRGLMAAMMVLVDDDDEFFQVNNWLRDGTSQCVIGQFKLPALTKEPECFELLKQLTRLANATGAPLIIALDQIEAITRVGDEALLSAVVTTAVQLVENCPSGIGLIISALTDTYQTMIKGRLDASFCERIELGQQSVLLNQPDETVVRAVLDKRTKVLLARAGVVPVEDASKIIAPDWLLRQSQYTTMRKIFHAVSDYQGACRSAGRFLSEQEFQPNAAPPPVDPELFDKLWADMQDEDLGTVANYSSYDREQMFLWLATHAGDELDGVASVTAEEYELSDTGATRMIDLRFQGEDSGDVERWKIAFADAPNRNNRLLEQIRSALDNASDARPALLRNGRMPGVDDSGQRDRSPAALRRLQAGPALDDLFAAGGRVATTTLTNWQRLKLAQRFVEQCKDAHGFMDWRQQRRFLLEHAEIGQMVRLIQPAGGNDLPPGTSLGLEGFGSEEGRETVPEPRKEPEVPPDTSTIPLPSSSDTQPFDGDPRDHANILIGHGDAKQKISWCLDKSATLALPNFGMLVSGDAGQGKTQAIKAIVTEAVRLGCPILIFDFKNDYGGSFAAENGFNVVDLNRGLPFNPLRLTPRGASGAQPIDHIYEIAGILRDTLRLGDQQHALLKDALSDAFDKLQVPLDEWVDPDTTPAPSLADVIQVLQENHAGPGAALINRIGLLHDKNLLPADAGARIDFQTLIDSRTVLSFSNLPNDDRLKRALAELILIQLQAHMLRGDQPGALRRLLVFDEAWRAADSKRLIELVREGRGFGVGVVAGSQFADDLSGTLTGNLATKLHLFNSDAAKRRKIVQATLGSATGSSAAALLSYLGKLKRFEGIFINQQYAPYTELTVWPHYQRGSHAETGSGRASGTDQSPEPSPPEPPHSQNADPSGERAGLHFLWRLLKGK